MQVQGKIVLRDFDDDIYIEITVRDNALRAEFFVKKEYNADVCIITIPDLVRRFLSTIANNK